MREGLLEVHVPDYRGGSIVNLMSSLRMGLGGGVGGAPSPYPPLAQLGPEVISAVRNVVLIVIDGMGYELLVDRGDGNWLRGHMAARLTSVFPSTTASAITTFLTGTAPQQHGLTGWFMFFKELGVVSAVLPFTPRYGRIPLSRSGVDPDAFFGHQTFFDEIPAQSHAIQPAYIMDSDFSRVHCGCAERHGYHTMDQFFGRISEILRADRRRKYVYAYWAELDSLAHEHGVNSRAVAAHLAALDAGFAELCASTGDDQTLLVVTADHGLIDTDPDSQLWLHEHPALAETLALPLCGEPRVGYCYVHAGQRSRFEAYVRDELGRQTELYTGAELMERGLFGLGEPHPRLRDRIGDYALVMKENYVIRDRLFGEHPSAHVGVHGGVSAQEMYVPLITCRL